MTDQPHRFNDDLLSTSDDRSRALTAYPNIGFGLIFPELCSEFLAIDTEANSAKRRTRRWGLLAIGMGTMALLIASAGHFYLEATPIIRTALGSLATALGIASAAVGGRAVLHSGSKKVWLRRRFSTERLRQYHFQFLLARFWQIALAAGDMTKIEGFLNERRHSFLAFKQRVLEHSIAQFEETMQEEAEEPDWPDDWSPPTIPVGLAAGKELFLAYRELRFAHQLNYARYKLRSPIRLFDYPPRRQEMVLTGFGLTCIALVFLAHLGFAVSIVLGRHQDIEALGHVGVLWLAILGLAAKALEEGLQPQKEVERYENYARAVRAAFAKFEESNDPNHKFAAMRDLERTAYAEMKQFLKTNERARFII